MVGWQAGEPLLVLASGSATRRSLLESARLAFDVHVTDVDESILKREMRARAAAADEAAVALASAKAASVSRHHEDALVIGADQILTCGEQWYDKPADLDEARRHLRQLRGQAQILHTAIVIVEGGETTWQYVAQPRLTMHRFSDDVLEAYLALEGDAVLTSVGACRIEGPGGWLFSEIEGEHAAILGLPMLALGAELRRRKILRS